MPLSTKNDCGSEPPIPTPKKVLIGDSQKIYSLALEQMIKSSPGFEAVGSFTSFEQLIAQTAVAEPDLVLLDDQLLESTPDRIRWVQGAHPEARIIVIVREAEIGFCLGIVTQGAKGVISRHAEPDIFLGCIRNVASGSHWHDHQVSEWILNDWLKHSLKTPTMSSLPPRFSPRETQIATLLIRFDHDKDIASEMGTNDQSIRNCLHRMYLKVGVKNRHELRAHCIQRGLLAPRQQARLHDTSFA